jgi:hypothetical protein
VWCTRNRHGKRALIILDERGAKFRLTDANPPYETSFAFRREYFSGVSVIPGHLFRSDIRTCICMAYFKAFDAIGDHLAGESIAYCKDPASIFKVLIDAIHPPLEYDTESLRQINRYLPPAEITKLVCEYLAMDRSPSKLIPELIRTTDRPEEGDFASYPDLFASIYENVDHKKITHLVCSYVGTQQTPGQIRLDTIYQNAIGTFGV